jgi:hypothetical protein
MVVRKALLLAGQLGIQMAGRRVLQTVEQKAMTWAGRKEIR